MTCGYIKDEFEKVPKINKVQFLNGSGDRTKVLNLNEDNIDYVISLLHNLKTEYIADKASQFRKISIQSGFNTELEEHLVHAFAMAKDCAERGKVSFETQILKGISNISSEFIKSAKEAGFSITTNSHTGSAKTVEYIVLNW